VQADTVRYLASRLVTTALIVFGAMLLLFTLYSIVHGAPKAGR
jgi:peptide/nickel transport system permease protein